MLATRLLAVGAELGEGPAWIGGALWFVDLKAQAIYRHDPAAGATERWTAPEIVGWIVPSVRGDFIAGLRSGPHRFSPDDGSFVRIAAVEPDLPGNRLNDAAVDRRGRILFGTMDDAEAAPTGRVYMLDRGKVWPTALPAARITNGPAIAPEGDRLYHVDTLARVVTRHAIGADGAPGAGEPFLRFGEADGYPDGATCDAAGGVWIGFYGGWTARRFAPDAALTDEVRFPVANVTKIALGGADGRTAFATTARQGLERAALLEQPMAGDVFAFPVAVPAAAATRANS